MRKLIRDAVKSIIETDMPGAFGEVSISRRNRVPAAALPCCSIYTDGEEAEAITTGDARDFERSLELVVKIFVKGDDDALDVLAYGVEDALSKSRNLGVANVSTVHVSGWEVDGVEDEGDNEYLAAEVKFRCVYITQEVR